MLEHYQNNQNKTVFMIGTITIDEDENHKIQWRTQRSKNFQGLILRQYIQYDQSSKES